jgi:hypothetical protein
VAPWHCARDAETLSAPLWGRFEFSAGDHQCGGQAIAKPSLDLNSEEADDVEEFQDPRRKTKEKGVPKPANPTEKQEKKRRAPSEAKEVVSPKKAKHRTVTRVPTTCTRTGN